MRWWDEFWFRFWEYWHCENFNFVGLDEYVHDACGKSLLACINFVLWKWQNFVGKFVGMGKPCGHEILIYGKILLVMLC